MVYVAERESLSSFVYQNPYNIPGDLCVYEFKLPDNSIPGDKLEVQIQMLNENLEFYFALGT